MIRSLRLLALCLAALLTPLSALAAGLRTEVSARQVVVGEPITVQATISSDNGQTATFPKLKVQGQAEQSSPSVSTGYRASFGSGGLVSEKTTTATWRVTPTETGKLILSTTAKLGGKTLTGETIVVRVEKADPSRPPRQLPRSNSRTVPGFDPFDIWTGRRRSARAPVGLPTVPEELKLDHAPDPIAFLHGRVDKDRVVIGEPLTLSIYAYGSRGRFVERSPSEPPAPDFLSFTTVETSREEAPRQAVIDGQTYVVLKLREIILVPLKTGELEIGSMRAILRGNGNRYPAQGSQFGTSVASQPLTITVVEPPTQGRPDGYTLGDVGRFRLEATVTPRAVEVGGYVEARVTLRGTGHLPDHVLLPEVSGLVWGKPTSRGGTEIDGGRLKGTRTLIYTAQVTQAGDFELGDASLPSFDPSTRQYRVARADLGRLQVDPAVGASAPSAAKADESAAGVVTADESGNAPLEARDAFGDYRPRREPPPFWLWLAALALPLVALAIVTVPALAGRLRRLFTKSRQRSPESSALRDAKQALDAGDSEAVSKHLERGLYAILETQHGLRARAVLRSSLAKKLTEVGLDKELADSVQELVLEYEAIRYQQSATDLSALLARSKKVFRQLSHRKGPKKESQA